MSRRKKTTKARLGLLGALLCLGALLAIPGGASAAAPKWELSIASFPPSFGSGATGNASEGPGYRVVATNKGDGPTTAPYTITATLPSDLTPVAAEVSSKPALSCETNEQVITCTGTEPLGPHTEGVKGSGEAEVIIPVEVATGTAGKSVLAEASVEGGGAALAKASARTAIGLPAWKISGISAPTNVPGGGTGTLLVNAVNFGGAGTTGTRTVTVTLPEGLTPTKVNPAGGSASGGTCSIVGRTATCVSDESVFAGGLILLSVFFKADLVASGTLLSEATVDGGGATGQVSTVPVTISPTVAPFGFLGGEDGLAAPLTGPDGAAAIQAGSHPHQLTINLGFPSELPNLQFLTGAEEVRDVVTDLPPGTVVNPNATTKLCTEAQLAGANCPTDAQIGSVAVTTALGNGFVGTGISPLFNMPPTPGTPSTFGFDAAGAALLVHIDGSLRSDGDYGLSGTSREIFARGPNPVLGIRAFFWSNPSNTSHDSLRERCGAVGSASCIGVEETKEALLTAPVQCSGQQTVTRARADSWEQTGAFRSASYESADLAGTPVAISGCNQLQYEPTLEAKPTTNLADSPSGLDVKVHQPVNLDPDGLSPGVMKDIRLVLPEGMSVNPSSADGLSACSEAQAHFHTRIPAECPAESKLGFAEVTTPLLDEPLTGALYLAEPFENPSGSLIALYLAVSDPSTGIVSNLAGRVQPDPVTGQLTTIFEDNPQLPIEDIETHLFTGPRAALRTPPACGAYAARADITPWSAPQTPVAHPTDPFAIQANPNSGPCPAQGQPLPSSPSFTAGTLSPQAGNYSPFVLKLTRQDDTSEIQKIDTALPPGLTAKLAGVPYCSEAAIAQAQSRSKPNEGIVERNNPSCPASSEIGTVDVAAGAGITPLHTPGKAYLAGPYKGAPLSVVVITPAIAGPFDLGAVVVRIALQVDPETAEVTAVSDPLPHILQGIPLDVRQISLQLHKPDFTLNPTSCDPMSIAASLASTQGQLSGPLVPFQVGGCDALSFKPKLALSLKGATKRTGHPALTATLTFPKGQGANVKRAEVTLPRSEFLDQAHIGTVCTRVQFAADQCPAASVYGKASATTPLLDEPLSGPVYLRSSSHELPDLVIALEGQVDVVLAGRVDSVKGGIRTTFEAAPDAPVSKFTLQMKGGKKGLLINSANLCKLRAKQNRATVLMDGQNGKVSDSSPLLANSCKKAKRPKKAKKSAR